MANPSAPAETAAAPLTRSRRARRPEAPEAGKAAARQTGSSNRWVAVSVLVIGVFMSVLDSTIVNIAIPKMMAVFSATTDQIEWVITGYMLTQGVLIPITGWLQDRYGAKRLYVLSLALFTIGSALSGAAVTTTFLITARVIQAIGGGMLMPISMTMMLRLVPPEERGMAMGIFGVAVMFAPALGPTIGGYIVQYMDWRLIFFVNVPIGIIGCILAAWLIQPDQPRDPGPLDVPGFISSVVGLFTLLYALTRGNELGWTSPEIVSMFMMAAFSTIAFVWIELIMPHPMMELRLLKNFTFSLSLAVSALNSIFVYVAIFMVPLFLQNLAGETALQVGLLMLPAAVVTGVLMPISGKLFDWFGARWLIVVGMIVGALGNMPFSNIAVTTPAFAIGLWFVFRRAGASLGMMPVMAAGMNEVSDEMMAQGTALSNTVRQVASSFGIAAFTSLLTNRTIFHAARLSASLQPGSPGVSSMMQSVLALLHISPAALYGASSQGGVAAMQVHAAMQKVQVLGLFALNGFVQQQAFVLAMDDVFRVSTYLAIVAAVLGLFFRKQAPRPNKDVTAMEA